MDLRTVNAEVYQAIGPVVSLRQSDVAFLTVQAQCSERARARLCIHPDAADRLHEMLIVLTRGTYIRPHRHAGKSESFHAIEGEFDVVIFHHDGALREVIRMGDYRSDKAFYYRLMDDCFHTVLINTPSALFHETTNGPFHRADTEFAPWAPVENAAGAGRYLEELRLNSSAWIAANHEAKPACSQNIPSSSAAPKESAAN